jgi:hypothetical protein
MPAESEKERVDRELIELLNELRIALPGVQVLFAFLLTLPFTNRFPETTGVQRDIYFVALVAAVVSTALLIAPTAYHRINFRQQNKERLLWHANRLALAGLLSLAVSLLTSLYVVTGFLFGSTAVAIVLVLAGGLFLALWYVLPMWIRFR